MRGSVLSFATYRSAILPSQVYKQPSSRNVTSTAASCSSSEKEPSKDPATTATSQPTTANCPSSDREQTNNEDSKPKG